MDTLLAAAVHKKNVHVGGGKTFNMRKPIKLKPAGKRRKALANCRDTYVPSSGVSNDVDLKTMIHGKQQIAGEDLFTTKKPIVNRASKVAYLNTRSMSLGNFEMGNKLLNHVLSDEKIKQCSECGLKEAIEETKCYECALKEAIEEAQCSTWYINEDEESAFGISFIHLQRPLLDLSYFFILQRVDKGHKIEDPDLHSTMSFPGPPFYTPFYTPKELDDLLDEPLLFLNKYPVPEEFEFEDDFGLDNLWS